jgi:senataxin
MRVQVHRKDKKEDLQFMPNDLVVLIPDKSKEQVEAALKGNSTIESLRKHGLVGHTEFRRDSMDGLLLRVSKRWWATLGEKDMYLFKLGSNITAVREFTALCRVESLPLKRYILGQHLVDNEHKKVASPGKNKHAMLDAMGGSDALGKGFIHYVQNKFNPSQLAAISAAAEEYGDGGFTLCKGRTYHDECLLCVP